jgi:plasmid replication initiation protein
MTMAARRRLTARVALLDRSLEELPLFRLSDAPDDAVVTHTTESGGRWRVLAAPGDRLPGTFDQDVYVELMHRFHEAGSPRDGLVTFTLHAFLRSLGRRADGRTYEQLRGALTRLERTTLESTGSYLGPDGQPVDQRFTILSAVMIERRRAIEREQLPLFPSITTPEPGVARVIIAAAVRDNLAARRATTISMPAYLALPSPVARRLYRLLEVARADGRVGWRISLDQLRELLPLTQRFPSHLQRVLGPAHTLLQRAGLIRGARLSQGSTGWTVDYALAPRPAPPDPGR